jgi:hypothetical protein
VWDVAQDGHIQTLEEQVEELRHNMEIACMWINHLNIELEKLKNEQRRTKSETLNKNVEGPECC